jgi:hypothetical protein
VATSIVVGVGEGAAEADGDVIVATVLGGGAQAATSKKKAAPAANVRPLLTASQRTESRCEV